MKYRTFRNLVSSALFLAMGGTCYGCYSWWHRSLSHDEFARRDAVARQEADAHRREREAERTRRAASGSPATPSEATSSTWLSAAGLREVDRDALTALKRPVIDKLKDVTKGKPWKINVYDDDGQRFNRLKIDLDRDELDDESWTIFADGHIERRAASGDDGNFDRHYRLDMTGWIDMKASPVPPSTSLSADDAMRDVDREMFALVKTLTPTAKVKDATKGKPYKINLYADDGQRFGRAKVDLDRDDRWDESWTWKDESVERQVSPNDDENYTQIWVLSGEAWKRK